MRKIRTYKLPGIVRFAKNYQFFKNMIFGGIFLSVALVLLLTGQFSVVGIVFIVVCLTLTLVYLIQLFRESAHKMSFEAWKHDIERTPNHFTINSGAPGSGKTLDETASGYYMAKWSWAELQYEYWLIYNQVKHSNHILTEDEREVVESYNFYMNNDGIPCLTTNYPIESLEYDRFSYKLTSDLLSQRVRSPYRNVLLIDEIGTVQNMELYKDRESNAGGAADMSDFDRFIRQFCEGRAIGSEQEATNVFKDTRRVVASIKKFKRTKTVLKPIFLQWLYDKLKNRFVKRMKDRDALFWSKFMLRFRNFLNNCGYFRLEYNFIQGSETSDNGTTTYVEESSSNGKSFKYYMPCALPFKYRSRIFRSAYKPIAQEISLTVYDSLNLTRDDSQNMLKAVTLDRLTKERLEKKRVEKEQAYLEHQRVKEAYKLSKEKK